MRYELYVWADDISSEWCIVRRANDTPGQSSYGDAFKWAKYQNERQNIYKQWNE